MVRGQAPRATRRGGKGRPPQTEDISVKGKGRGEIHGKRSRGTHQSDKPVMRGKGHRAKRGRGGGRNPQTKETVPQGRELRATSTRRSGRCQTKGTVAREVGSRETCEKKLGKDTTASKRGRRSQQRGATSSRQGRGRGVVRRGFCNEDLTRVALLQQKRSEAMNMRLAKMGVKELRRLLGCIVTREPGMVFDVLDSMNPGGPLPPPPSSNPHSWCTCGRCRDMPTDLERKCCGLVAPNCISILPEFDLFVIDPMYLRQFNRYRGQIFGIPGHGDNAAMRHAAYTQFILLKHGKLGYQNRRVIPSCCVWKIRATFPEQSGVYRSFALVNQP